MTPPNTGSSKSTNGARTSPPPAHLKFTAGSAVASTGPTKPETKSEPAPIAANNRKSTGEEVEMRHKAAPAAFSKPERKVSGLTVNVNANASLNASRPRSNTNSANSNMPRERKTGVGDSSQAKPRNSLEPVNGNQLHANEQPVATGDANNLLNLTGLRATLKPAAERVLLPKPQEMPTMREQLMQALADPNSRSALRKSSTRESNSVDQMRGDPNTTTFNIARPGILIHCIQDFLKAM